MAERTSYAPGVPSFVDVSVADTERAHAFYAALFGWDVDVSDDPEAGGFGMYTLRGKSVAGVGPRQDPNVPPHWKVYVTVEDVDATAAAAGANGGTVLLPPVDVLTAGRMAVFQDPGGSVVAAWQPNTNPGAQLVNEVGAFTWNELSATDLDAARSFYTTVFAWGIDEELSADGGTIFTAGGNVICGAHTAGEGEFPAWSIWFSVEDCDEAAATVTDAGGSVIVPPNDMDFGRGAVVADDQGAVFGIAVVNPEMRAD